MRWAAQITPNHPARVAPTRGVTWRCGGWSKLPLSTLPTPPHTGRLTCKCGGQPTLPLPTMPIHENRPVDVVGGPNYPIHPVHTAPTRGLTWRCGGRHNFPYLPYLSCPHYPYRRTDLEMWWAAQFTPIHPIYPAHTAPTGRLTWKCAVQPKLP